jgi:hypothetical protein
MAAISKESLMAIYPAIGELCVSWAIGEQSLDSWVLRIFQRAGGHHLEDELPRSFSRKIGFLRRCFRLLEPLQPYAERAAPIMDLAVALADHRNYLVHGAIRGETTDGKIRFCRVEYEKTDQRVTERVYSVLEVLDFGGLASTFSGDALGLAGELADSEWSKT